MKIYIFSCLVLILLLFISNNEAINKFTNQLTYNSKNPKRSQSEFLIESLKEKVEKFNNNYHHLSVKNQYSSPSKYINFNVWVFFKNKKESIEEYNEDIDKIISIDRDSISPRQHSKWLNSVSISIRVYPNDKINNLHYIDHFENIIQNIQKHPNVKSVQQLYSIPSQYKLSPSKPTSFQRSNVKRSSEEKLPGDELINGIDYGGSYENLKKISVLDAHKAGITGKGVKILVIDTGFLKSHESLVKLNLVDEYDFIDNTTNTQSNDTHDEQNAHGTFILSTLAAYQPGTMVGVAYDSEYLLAKTEIVAAEETYEEDLFIAAVEWGASKGVKVISASLGYSDFYKYWELDGSSPISKCVDIATSKGITVVISNGNNGNKGISPPADSHTSISVGALDGVGEAADFSSMGPTSDGRLKPEISAPGVLNFVASGNSPTDYLYESGTSLSAPLVAGVVSLIIQKHPDWTPQQIKEALVSTASNQGSPNNYVGFGMINAMAAIQYQPSSPKKSAVSCENCNYESGGICLNGKCVCSNNQTSTCSLKGLCGYLCKNNGGKCSENNCFKCIDPKGNDTEVTVKSVSQTCQDLLSSEPNQIDNSFNDSSKILINLLSLYNLLNIILILIIIM
ncbi:hypothetical protein DLAC_06915 [Tieghemostelium lacteum]|uniref:Peptidase S8/S53 domain-containing protein n=1 Tax=Tieghemostelium lacteum TaxID=361077 RepID=A0A151ZDQ5_TIELA|nr:hypothetical protein DLAC_06915 [Tieghemostelium lacteum]|eukprot:KYQ92077.1 hypothetical protein DLAC_06915 [Tieghemostelium lacteum]